MPNSINTNLSAFRIMREMDTLSEDIQRNMVKLSTGLRINDGADDPAGLVRSENYRAQIHGIAESMKNTQDGIHMIKTTEAALNEVQRLLQEMKVLSIHAANTATVSADQLEADQDQIRNKLNSISRIASNTSFGETYLLNGTSGVMANIISPANVQNLSVAGNFAGQTVANGPITGQVTAAATKASMTLGNGFANQNAIVTMQGTFSINGYAFTSQGNMTVKALVDQINEASSVTGVTASLAGTGPVSIRLDAVDYGNQFGINLADGSLVVNNAAISTVNGTNATLVVSATTVNGVALVTLTGGQGLKQSGLSFSDADGNAFSISEAGNGGGLTTATQIGQLTSGSIRFQIGPEASQCSYYSMPNVYASNLGNGVIPNMNLSNIDIRSSGGAANAMQVIDAALAQVSKMRGNLGSFQADFLESTKRSLAVERENLIATESTIRDANIAEEMAERMKLMIRYKSTMAVAAQANQEQSDIIQLFS